MPIFTGGFILIGLAALTAISLLLAPKPPKDTSAKKIENPVADASKPLPVVFGTMTVKEVNVLWYGDQTRHTSKVKP